MMDAMDIQAVESKLNDVTVTAIPMTNNSRDHHHQMQPHNYSTNSHNNHHYQPKAHSQSHHQKKQYYPQVVPQPAHQSFKLQQQQNQLQQRQHQQQHQYHALPSPSSPHISMVPTSQLSPAITATRVQAAALATDLSSPVSLTPSTIGASQASAGSSTSGSGLTKYAQLLSVIEEMGRDIRPTYSGSRSSAEHLKRGIVHARILVRECLVETEKSGRQN